MRAKALSTWAGVMVMAATPAVLGAQAARPAAGTQTAKPAATASAAKAGGSLGSVRVPSGVSANGQPLAAGTYTLRLTDDPVTPVVGQRPDAAKWVEFVQGGAVKGKELATVVAAADVQKIAKMAPPASGTAKVQTLKGADYVRIWINHGGTHYLVHLNEAGAK